MYQPPYFICLLLILTNKVLGEFCDPVTFLKLSDVEETDAPYNSLVNSLHKETLNDCLKHMTLTPSLLWFLYDLEKKECVTGQCWDIQLQGQLTNRQVLYRKPVSVPRSCSDVKTASPDAEDGEYWIYPDAPTFLGCPTKIYCYNMAASSPVEFLTLSITNTRVYPSKQNLFCSEEQNHYSNRTGTTDFHKIRVDIVSMTVEMYDFTFAVGTGDNLAAYGFAEDCYSETAHGCGPLGTFNIDTTQTGIIVSLQQTWSALGHESHEPSMTRSADGRQIYLLCGGSCGGCKPTGQNLQLHRNSQEVLPGASAQFVLPG